jgi:polyisoprenoid-binding protein YceI
MGHIHHKHKTREVVIQMTFTNETLNTMKQKRKLQHKAKTRHKTDTQE